MFTKQYVIAQNALTRTGAALKQKISDQHGDAMGESVAVGAMLVVAGVLYTNKDTFSGFITDNIPGAE